MQDSIEQRMPADYHHRRQKLAEELLLPKAERGEVWAIRNLLTILADALKDEAPVSGRCSVYLAKALTKISEGENANAAFGIRRKRGERDLRKKQAQAFLRTYRVEVERLKNITLEEAISRVAESERAKEDTVKAAWKKNHKEAKRLIQLELQYEIGLLGI